MQHRHNEQLPVSAPQPEHLHTLVLGFELHQSTYLVHVGIPLAAAPYAPYRWLAQLRSPLGCSHRSILTNRRCSRAGDAVLAGWPAAAARPMAGGPPLLSVSALAAVTRARAHMQACRV